MVPHQFNLLFSLSRIEALIVFTIVCDVFGEDESVSVKEGFSVTLNTNVTTGQWDIIRWYFNDTLIAHITAQKICTDVQCNEGTERFRDRLKVDHQTGSLIITNTTTEHAGDYKLQIRNPQQSEKSFNITVLGVSAAEQDEIKRKTVKEGESVTLDAGVIKNPNDVMMWYFNDTLIAEITGNQSKICTDDQCDERFRDRLKLDHQTGSLNITNTRTTDSGLYILKITIRIHRRRRRHSITSETSFHVDVIAFPGSGLSSAAVSGICVGVVVFAFCVIYVYCRKHKKETSIIY
ncbi:uncharacterized protein LOC125263384 [Megalobrama amblycephala]|uniref:uncharacterized protein LOC125263384 n=1 Tax=Megalobrama amblycephala TaxID=75352 RepID=UPI00201471C3|nr:uncharacterized protein LOC125263384 [Megalobrama amblycephala]